MRIGADQGALQAVDKVTGPLVFENLRKPAQSKAPGPYFERVEPKRETKKLLRFNA